VTTPYELHDLGAHRLLRVDGREYATDYSKRVVELLIERKGVRRTPPYFTYKRARGDHFLGPLFRWLRARGAPRLRVLEVGCSFGHITEWLAEQPQVAEIHAFDADAQFVEIVKVKREELDLKSLIEVRHLTSEETRHLPWGDGVFDLVLALGVVEHLPWRGRSSHVDEYWRVLAPGGHIAILDTPNRWFPYESHSVGLPFVQFLPARAAWHYARTFRRRTYGDRPLEHFLAEDIGTGWRNATYPQCLPSGGRAGIEELTEEAGYGWRFFRDTARSRTRRVLLPAFALAVAALNAAGKPPSWCLPYLNLLFRRTPR
jgi:2-polyprenyl-3-methyl-5-hydroxy-6-metoxy-1,4-benzoquinol methylase